MSIFTSMKLFWKLFIGIIFLPFQHNILIFFCESWKGNFQYFYVLSVTLSNRLRSISINFLWHFLEVSQDFSIEFSRTNRCVTLIMCCPFTLHVTLPSFRRIYQNRIRIQPGQKIQLVHVGRVVVPPRYVRTDAQCEMPKIIKTSAASIKERQ